MPGIINDGIVAQAVYGKKVYPGVVPKYTL